MLYSNNLTTFITSLVDDGAIVISEEDDILVGAPEGSDFYVNGMGGVLICQNGEMHPKQTRLGGALNDPEFLIEILHCSYLLFSSDLNSSQKFLRHFTLH